jgi:hypothetical protein
MYHLSQKESEILPELAFKKILSKLIEACSLPQPYTEITLVIKNGRLSFIRGPTPDEKL